MESGPIAKPGWTFQVLFLFTWRGNTAESWARGARSQTACAPAPGLLLQLGNLGRVSSPSAPQFPPPSNGLPHEAVVRIEGGGHACQGLRVLPGPLMLLVGAILITHPTFLVWEPPNASLTTEILNTLSRRVSWTPPPASVNPFCLWGRFQLCLSHSLSIPSSHRMLSLIMRVFLSLSEES